jgi:hypothetical protein
MRPEFETLANYFRLSCNVAAEPDAQGATEDGLVSAAPTKQQVLEQLRRPSETLLETDDKYSMPVIHAGVAWNAALEGPPPSNNTNATVRRPLNVQAEKELSPSALNPFESVTDQDAIALINFTSPNDCVMPLHINLLRNRDIFNQKSTTWEKAKEETRYADPYKLAK